MAKRTTRTPTQPYKVPGSYAERDLLVIVYREYQYRKAVYDKILGNSAKSRNWGIKVNKFVAVFNKMEAFVDKAERLDIVGNGSNWKQKDGIDDVLKYVSQEVRNREKFYPDFISRGIMTYEEAYKKTQGMKAVFNFLLKVKASQGVQSSLQLPDD
jgi:hypothetical protein